MPFIFRLKVKQDRSCLELVQDGHVQAYREWPESRDMGRQLFGAIDSILKERNLNPEEIEDFQVETDIPDTFTSIKIAQTVAETYRFAAGSE